MQSEIELQERDIIVLRDLFETRLTTLKHLAATCFHDSHEAAKKRVQKLKRSGALAERPRRAYEPSILFLTVKGFTMLSERGVLADYPFLTPASFEKRAHVSDLTLKHELDILEVKTALTLAIRETPHVKIVEFSTWPALFEFESAPGRYEPERTVRPDGFIRIQIEDDNRVHEDVFFLEVDRSTEVLERLAIQACCYRQYYRSGGLAERFGREHVPFRVLIVLQNTERRNNTAASLLRLSDPVLEQAWLTSLPELRANPLGNIWIRPVDYRDVTTGTAFDTRLPFSSPYRRQPERENMVEESIIKRGLLDAANEKRSSQEGQERSDPGPMIS